MGYGARTSTAGATCYRGVVVYKDDKGEIRTEARGPYETKRPCNAFINVWIRENAQRKAPKPDDFVGRYWDWYNVAPNEPYDIVEAYIEEPAEWRKVPR